jgi:hypothetical protein
MGQESSRLDLQALLELVIGSENVYFQPPASFTMVYPCIVYERYSSDSKFADDYSYIRRLCYQLTVIDRDPDSPILDKVSNLPLCSYDRHYKADNLNHDVYKIYY